MVDAGYGQFAEFRQGLSNRGISYIVATTSSTTAQPTHAEPVAAAYAGVGPYPTQTYPYPARSIKDIALDHGAEHTRLVHWRERLPANGDTALAGSPITRVAAQYGTSRQSLHTWRSRFEATSETS